MINILKQKISPVLAFVFVIVFGLFSIFLMDRVFQAYADDELLTRVNRLEQLLQEKGE